MTWTLSARVRTATVAVALVILGLVTVSLPPTAAALDTAAWSGSVPADGAVTAVRPTSVTVTSQDNASIISATTRINGVLVNVFVDYAGHTAYDEDAEAYVWVVDDYRQARITGYLSARHVVPGLNTVVTTVTSASGVSTYTRTFTYGSAVGAPVVSAFTPADASVLGKSPALVSASITSPLTSFTSTLTIDGVNVAPTFDTGTKTFSYTPHEALAPGRHSVTFAVRDSTGGTATRSWSFTVRTPMSSSSECVTCHTGFPAAHPISGCEACHASGYVVTGGSHGADIPTPTGCGSTGAEQAGTCHDLDHREDSGFGIWGSGPFSCVDCHNASRPAVPRHDESAVVAAHEPVTPTFCAPCHDGTLVTEHAKYPTAADIKYQCDTCHGAATRAQAREAVAGGERACGACHSHGHAEQHANPSQACAGPGCHAGTDLTAVHTAIGCEGCHSSSREEVVLAIEAGKKACASCHNPVAVHGAAHEADPTYRGAVPRPPYTDPQGPTMELYALECLSCHRSNLLALHGSDTTNCAICHAEGGPASSIAAWDKTCQTGACHPGEKRMVTAAGGEFTQAPHGPMSVPMDHQLVASGQQPTGYCQSCHGNPQGWRCGAPFGCHLNVGPATSVDYLAPVTTATRTGTDVIVWRLSATDIGDGVAATYYSFDGGEYQLYGPDEMANGITNPADISAPYAHTLRYYSIDKAGHTEEIESSAYNVTDNVAPVVTFSGVANGDNIWVDKSMTMTVTDPKVNGLNTGVAFVHTEVRTFKTNWGWFPYQAFYQSMSDFTYPNDATWESPRAITGLENYAIAKSQPGYWPTYQDFGGGSGRFEMQYYARDHTGNQTPMQYAFIYIDNKAPVTSVNSAGAWRWKFFIDDSAGAAATYYSFDGAQYGVYTADDAINGIANTQPGGDAAGTHTLNYYTVDRLGHTESVKTYTYTR